MELATGVTIFSNILEAFGVTGFEFAGLGATG